MAFDVMENAMHKQRFHVPDTAQRAPHKQVRVSLKSADSPYKTYFPLAQTMVPYLQQIGRLSSETYVTCRRSQWSNTLYFFALLSTLSDNSPTSKLNDKGLAQSPTMVS